jgi:dienelactone hydrolase
MFRLKHLLLCAVWALALGARAQGASAVAVQTVEVKFPSAEAGVELTAYWTPPGDEPGGAAAVVALHGCGGLPADRAQLAYPRSRYVRMLRDAGAGVLYVDSFGPRGQDSICAQKTAQRSIQESNRRLDVIAALQWLAQQPGVDVRRLGVVGWSHGGQTVLAMGDGGLEVVRQAPVKPAALVAFYPGCTAVEKTARHEVSAPLLVMSGELDNWTPAAPCRRWSRYVQARGQPVRYVEYEGSYHAFDSTSPVSQRDNVGGTSSGKAMAGGNPLAREASAHELMKFLGQHLGLQSPPDGRTHATAVPPPSHFAALEDVTAVPRLSAKGRALYQEWLDKPYPRAVAVSDKGAMARGYGSHAMRDAVRNCEKLSAKPCRLYAVDDQVVWKNE